jgi:hypothetical protein
MLKILTGFEAYGKSAGLANAQRLKGFRPLAALQWHAYWGLCEVQRQISLYENWRRHPNRANDISFELGTRSYTVRSENGNGGFKGCLSSPVEDGHAHRFRDTFSTALSQAGVPLDRVSVLLHHRKVHCQLRPLRTREVTALEVESQINSRNSRRI